MYHFKSDYEIDQYTNKLRLKIATIDDKLKSELVESVRVQLTQDKEGFEEEIKKIDGRRN